MVSFEKVEITALFAAAARALSTYPSPYQNQQQKQQPEQQEQQQQQQQQPIIFDHLAYNMISSQVAIQLVDGVLQSYYPNREDELGELSVLEKWELIISTSSVKRLAVRTKFVDWCILRVVETLPSTQIVLLGSGLDTRPYRLSTLPNNLTFFEMDLPNVLSYKKEVLAQLSCQPFCRHLILHGDLSRHNEWVATLFQNGFDKDKPTLWVLEGLVMYFSKEDAHTLLCKIYELSAPSSRIILHTVNISEISPQEPDGADNSALFDSLSARMRFGVDDPLQLLGETGTWDDVASYDYEKIVEVLECREYLADTKTNSKFTTAIVVK